MTQCDLAVNGGSVVTPSGVVKANVGVVGERIALVSSDSIDGREIIDASECLVLPGLIDPHVHFRMPQGAYFTSDDYATGSRSAACGGVTTYIDFVVQPAGGSAVAAIRERLAEAESNSAIDFTFHAALTNSTDATLSEISELASMGVKSFKFFLTYKKFGFYTDLGFLGDAMREIARVGGVAVIHAEDDEILTRLSQKLMASGETGIRGLATQRPAYAEEIAIASVGILARETGCTTAIAHLSSRRGLVAVQRARKDGAPIVAETCPQYLILSQDLLSRPDGCLFTFTPTMKEPEDAEALWTGIADGGITYLGSDHSPFDRAVKLSADGFAAISPGIPGTETILPLFFSEGVGNARMSVERLVEMTSSATAQLFGLPFKGRIQIGSDADLVVLNPEKEVTISSEILHSRCDYTPYEGVKVRGFPVLTVSRGEVVMRDGKFVGRAGRGRFATDRTASVDRGM